MNEALLTRRPATAPASASGGATYALQPELSLLPALVDTDTEAAVGGVLYCLRPLMAMRLNARAFALVSALAAEPQTAVTAAARANILPAEASRFLDALVRRRLLACTPAVPERWPSVSIIVAARGRPQESRACVISLLELDYPGERCEIIVVDDASEAPLAPVLADLPIRLLRLDRNVGPAAARNLAAAEALGDVLAFIDNDCIAEPSWLQTLVPWFSAPATAIVGGRVVAPPPAGRIAAFEAVRSPLDMGAVASAVGPRELVAYLPTCNFLIRRDAFLAAGGFTPEMRLGEDVDLTWRLLASGAEARYVPAGRVIHYHRERLGALLARRADYASSEADLQRRHSAARRELRLPRVSLLVLAMLVAAPIRPLWAVAIAAVLAVLLGVEITGKRQRLSRLGLDLSATRIAAAVTREHVASLYGLSANVIRYYGLPLLALAALWPTLLPAVTILLLVAPMVDHRRLRPACGLVPFVGLYWLEMAAYQFGVWRGCLARRTFRPLLPLLRWRR